MAQSRGMTAGAEPHNHADLAVWLGRIARDCEKHRNLGGKTHHEFTG